MSHARNCICQKKIAIVDAGRQQAMKTCTETSTIGRRENLLASTADARLRGHAVSQQRVNQAIHDGRKPQKGTRRRTARTSGQG